MNPIYSMKLVEELATQLVERNVWAVGIGLHANDEAGSSYHFHVAVFHGRRASAVPAFYDGVPVRVLHVVKSQMSGDEIMAQCPICSRRNGNAVA